MSNRELDCRAALRLLAEYLDRELAADEHQLVERHLEKCRECYSRAEFERQLMGRFAALGRQDVEPELEKRVRGLIRSFKGDKGERVSGSPDAS